MYHLDSLLKHKRVGYYNNVSLYIIEGNEEDINLVSLCFVYKGYDSNVTLYSKGYIEKLKLSSLKLFRLILRDLYINNISIRIYTPYLSEFIHIVHRWGYYFIPLSDSEFKIDIKSISIVDVY